MASKLETLEHRLRLTHHPSTFRVLMTIGLAGELNVSQITRRSGVWRSMVSNVLRYLRDADLVTYQADWKVHTYRLTESGRKLYRGFLRLGQMTESELRSDLRDALSLSR